MTRKDQCMTYETLFKISTASVLAGVCSFFGAYVPVLCCVLFCIAFDVLTGLVKAKVTGEPISSKTGIAGFWRKMALLLGLIFGIFLDVYIPILLGAVAIDIPFKLPIGTLVGCYITLNESISILENLNKAAPGAMPKWIKKLLTGAKQKINEPSKG